MDIKAPLGLVSRPPTLVIPGTKLEYNPIDVSEDGKISLMIHARDQRELNRLTRQMKKEGVTVLNQLGLVRSLVAELPVAQAQRFIHDLPKRTQVYIDSAINYPDCDAITHIQGGTTPFPSIFTSQTQTQDPGSLSASTPPTGTPPAGPVLVNGVDVDRADIGMPEVWKQGFNGKGVTVAVIDSGIYPHPDIKNHLKAFVDIADNKPAAYDSYGHGTQVAGSIAGDGTQSHGQITGTAPGADLVGVRITTVSEAIKGLEWVIANKDKYNIRVVNLSLGDTPSVGYQNDLWCQACEKAIQAGLVVVVAAGNEGPDVGSVSTPGIDPNVITVGAVDNKKTIDKSDDTVAPFSSRGPTNPDNLVKPDILAPGVRVFGPLSPNSKLDQPEIPHIGNDYEALTGSSQATPLVSGVIACMLQANPNLTPAQIKTILTTKADHYLKDDANQQGAGVINAAAAVAAALALAKPAPTAPTAPAVASPLRPTAQATLKAFARPARLAVSP